MSESTTNQSGLLAEIFGELKDPTYKPWRVGLSMCASWSMGVSMAAGLSLLAVWGLGPFIVWMTFNTLAIPVFSIIYVKVPQFRQFINFRIGLGIMLLVAFLQITLNQNAMRAALAGGVDFASYGFISTGIATYLVMGISTALFLFIYKYELPGSVTTDVVQYFGQVGAALVIVATGVYFGFSGVDVPLGVEPSEWLMAATLGILLGPYVDPTQWQRIEQAPQLETGIWGGVFFGFYMALVLASALVFGSNSLLHGALFAIVVFSVATSTLDSLAAAMQRIFNNKNIALVFGLVGVGIFPFAGVIGVGELWSIFANYRAPIVVGILLIAFALEIGNRYISEGISAEMLKTRLDYAANEYTSIEDHLGPSDD